MKTSLTVLASGRGSNFVAVYNAILDQTIPNASIDCLIVDRPHTGAEDFAKSNKIPVEIIDFKAIGDKKEFHQRLGSVLLKNAPDYILALGFMRIIPAEIINKFTGKIINIHPSLLPAFPGLHAQKQAFEYGVKVSGCTVHYMDSGVDTGPIIDQRAVRIDECCNAAEVQQKILIEEHLLIVEVVKQICRDQFVVDAIH